MTGIDFLCLQPQPMAEQRLLFFPHAGAGASIFRDWVRRLPPTIELYAAQLPGRESRLNEPSIIGWAQLRDELYAAMTSLPAGPIAIYGHSLGAILALECARIAAHTLNRPLSHLFCAARPWPGATPPTVYNAAELTDEALLDRMRQMFGATDPTLAHPEVRQMILPILRADLSLLQSYQYQPARALPHPLTIYAGAQDPVSAVTDYRNWAAETAVNFDISYLQAGHLFHMTDKEHLARDIAKRLGAV